MNKKIKQCQNCNIKFTIEPEDFEFYKKIGVPAPTFCPDCRNQRRFVFRNEMNLYKGKCDFSGKDIISIYHPKNSYKIYDRDIWWSDKWDPMKYSQDYNFNQPFFKQFKKLYLKVPRINIFTDKTAVDSNYCNCSIYIKDCYLATFGGWLERIIYANRNTHSKDSLDLYISDKLELCYDCLYCYDSYKLFFSKNSHNCIESYFLYDCRHCQHCFGCTNLRHKKYYIFNKQYTKEEYFEKLKEFNLFSYNGLMKQKENYKKIYKKAIHKFAQITKSVDSIGDNLKNVKNCNNAFDVKKAEDCKFVNWGGDVCKDSYDSGPGFGAVAELLYESIDTGVEAARSFFTWVSFSNYDIQYSINCHSSHNLFACVGLRHKQYCILNKQYTKEEYNKLVPKIKNHMNEMPYIDGKKRVYKYGEFFPPELSPFGYNETIANEYFPLTKEEALKQGYNWYDKPKSAYKPTIKAINLPDNIKDVTKTILKEVIECGNCHSEQLSRHSERSEESRGSETTRALIRDSSAAPQNDRDAQDDKDTCAGSGVFRIIPQELKFYQKMNLPLPRLCPDCRHRERIKQRNPLKLWKRQCMNHGCKNTFKTTYSPDRKEIVYCEGCYNKEVG